MKINPQIKSILREFKIGEDEGVTALIALYFGYKPVYISDDFKRKMNTTKIVEPDNGTLKWNVSLFQGQETAFEWVKTEYVKLFSDKNSSRGGKVREATARMKKLFAENPDIRKEEILGATRMYMSNTDPDYIRFPHYFIEKGKGGEKTQDILDWIDKYRIYEDTSGRKSKDTIMQ